MSGNACAGFLHLKGILLQSSVKKLKQNILFVIMTIVVLFKEGCTCLQLAK